VSAFAALGDSLRPKSFAGLFGAAPSSNTGGPTRRLEILTGAGRGRSWTAAQKAAIVAESYGAPVGQFARRYGLRPQQLFSWRRQARQAALRSRGRRVAQPAADSTAIKAADAGLHVIELDVEGSSVWIRTSISPSCVAGSNVRLLLVELKERQGPARRSFRRGWRR